MSAKTLKKVLFQKTLPKKTCYQQKKTSEGHILGKSSLFSLLQAMRPLDWQSRLYALAEMEFIKPVFSTSFSFEDQAITQVIATKKLPIEIFTLDTGRLFEETYTLHQKTCKQYNLQIKTYSPDAESLQTFVNTRGINSFYDSLEDRLRCCSLRKTEPLSRALKGVDLWISGLRRAHSESRSALEPVVWDPRHNLIKLYPLLEVETDTLWAFIHQNSIPYNPLHERGFPSIGCAPCTRAVKPGEPARSGRWWWEQEGKQECGLHWGDGKLGQNRKQNYAG